jgi:hypothetical protein
MDYKVYKVLLEHKVFKVLMEHTLLKVFKVFKVNRVIKVGFLISSVLTQRWPILDQETLDLTMALLVM